jgi:O-antigen ligase
VRGTIGLVLAVIGFCGLLFQLVRRWRARQTHPHDGGYEGDPRLVLLTVVAAVAVLGLVLIVV